MAKNKTINMVKSQVIYKDYSKDAERTALVSGENLAHMFGKIARWYTDISWVGHTHTEANITDFGTYAGASTKGGAATSANKLNIGSSDIGSETKPVYFNATTGKPVACAYSLNASVPANAVFTDINVKQSPSTANESREVLFAGNTGNTETTGTVGKSNKLSFNPNTGALTATSFSGSVDASNLTGSIDAGRLPTTSVTAGSYGPAAGGTLAHGGTFDVAYVTVDKYGRLTGASTKTFTLPAQYVHPTYTSKTSGLYKITVDSLGHVSATAAVTASDLPSHTHAYLPLAGGTMTGGITYKGATYDVSAADNGVTTTVWPSTFNLIDKSDRIFTRIEGILYTNGDIGCQLYVRNYNISGTQVAQKGLQFVMNKSGSLTWSVSDPANFRSAISAAAIDHTHPYLPESTVTGSPDLDTYLTTGVYHITTQTSEHAPTTNHATLFVDGTVGTPYQLFIPDVSTGTWYSRYKSGSSAWSSWLSLKMTDTVYTHPTYTSKTSGLYKITVDGTGHVSATAAVAAADLPSHTHAYLPLSGGTMTGAITFQVADAIKYNAASATYTMISFITGDGNGHGISIGGGGLTVMGSGESASALISALSLAASNETTYIASDNNIEFYSNCQTIGNRLGIVFDTSGRLRPDTNNTRTLGGADYYWNKAYISQILGRGTGGMWISARDNAIVRQSTMIAGSAYLPVISAKTKLGEWSIGTLGPDSESLYFSYTTDANYSASTNTNKYYAINLDGAFSGSASKWTTARTLTIGSTGKSVDGSGNVSWSLSEIGAAATSHSHSNYLPQTTPTTAPDLNTYTTTGIYHIGTSSTNAPVTQHSTVYVEAGVGTPYQLFKPDNVDTVWYTRHKITDGWSDWVALKLTDTVYTHPTYTSKTSGLYKITVDGTGHVSGTAAVTAADLPAHTHSYLPLSGGTLTGNLTMGSSTQTTLPNCGITVHDIRSVNVPASGFNSNGRLVNFYFHMVDSPNTSQWWSIMHVKGWTSDYNAWELAGTAHNDDARTRPLYVRTSQAGTAWGSWRKIYDSSNKPTPSEIGAAASSHSHSDYLPLAGGTMTGDILFTGVTSTSYPAVSKTIQFSGSTDAASIFFEVTASDRGCLVLQTTDDADAKIIFRNKVTASGTRANEVTITDGVIAGNGSGLTNLNASNISSGTLAEARLPKAYIPLAGSTGVTGEIVTTAANGFRLVYNKYGAIIRNDGEYWWFLITAKQETDAAAKTATWANTANLVNNTHPFRIALSDGRVYINGYTINKSVPSTAVFTDTTYTIATGDSNGQIKVTPSSGSAYNVSVKGLGSAAYTASTAYAAASHTHSYIESKANYTFTSSTLPNSFDWGVSAGFVNSDSGFGSFGSVLTVRTYSGGGGTLQLYAPYSSTYGGTHLKARFGNYASSSGNSWTSLRELAWNDEKLGITTVTGSPDLDTYTTSGIYTIKSTTAVHSATNSYHTTLFVDGDIGTPYQILKPDANDTIWYTRHINSTTGAWTNWVTLNLADNKLGAISANGYWGMATKDGIDTDWIRTTSLGLIPYQSGGLNAGHQSIGTSSWYFSHAYIDNLHGCTLSLGAAGVQGRIDIQSTTTASVAYNSANPRIRFKNADASQNIDILMCDYDSVRGPAALSVHGNQGGEYLLAPNVASWDYTNNTHTAMLRTFSAGTTSAVGSGRVIAGNSIKKGVAGNARGYIEIYSEEDGCVFLISPTTITTSQSGYAVTLPSSAGTLALVGDNNHTHSQYLPKSTVTGSPDLDSYTTTGIYTINTSSASHSPTTNYSTLFVDGSVGTPFQILKPDANDTTWYTRHRNNSAGTWYSWVALNLNGISKSDLYKILWSGSTSCTARSSTDITLTTVIAANTYRFIKIVWTVSGGTGVSEIRADTLNVINNVSSASGATTANIIQFTISSDGKKLTVGPGTTAITVLQIAGVYSL